MLAMLTGNKEKLGVACGATLYARRLQTVAEVATEELCQSDGRYHVPHPIRQVGGLPQMGRAYCHTKSK